MSRLSRVPGANLIVLGVALFFGGCGGPPPSSLEPASPESVGLSSQGLDQATAVLEAHIDAGDIPGVVAAVARDGRLAYLESLGMRNLEDASPMEADALFRIYSMTRPITALGILMLHEDGMLDVNDPVQLYLPEFADQRVLRDPGSGDPSDFRPRNGDVTIAQLLTHTSGVGSRSSGMYTASRVHSYDQTLEELAGNVAALPLFEDPGTAYRYGMSAEILGRVIEVVTGMSAEQFLQERIFDPLGMTDTVFFVDGGRSHRLAPVYRPNDEGRLQPIEMEEIPVTERRALTSTGVGLVSSAEDLLRFGQLFLDGGRTGGRQLIQPETIRMAAENAIPAALLPLPGNGYWRGSGWSLGGFAVAMDPSAYGHGVSPGEFWWDGSTGTRFWIDPEQNMVVVVLAQVSPSSGNGFREAFKTAVHEAIVERR